MAEEAVPEAALAVGTTPEAALAEGVTPEAAVAEGARQRRSENSWQRKVEKTGPNPTSTQ